MTHTLRGSTAIVGVGTAGIGEAHGRTHLELMAEAANAALAEAGLTIKDVDGLFTSTLVNFFPTLTIGEYFGIHPKYVGGTSLGGSSFVKYAIDAAMALRAGLSDHRLCAIGGETHAPIRHQARTLGRGRGCRAQMGAAQSGRVHARRPHHRRGHERAYGVRSAERA
jgi:acetyl-CoA acetyltransferase